MQLTIRPMTEADWNPVLKIYEEGLATGQASFETSAPAWERWNASHHRHSRIVACDEVGVAGWAALSPASARACYAGVAEVSVYASGGGCLIRKEWHLDAVLQHLPRERGESEDAGVVRLPQSRSAREDCHAPRRVA